MARTMNKDAVSNTNGFDKKKSKQYIAAIEEQDAKIDAIMADAKDKCEPYRKTIREHKKEARQVLDVPADVLNATLSQRKSLRKAAAARNGMSDDHQAVFDIFVDAVGNLAGTLFAEAAEENAKLPAKPNAKKAGDEGSEATH